jgi:hypothetical protein
MKPNTKSLSKILVAAVGIALTGCNGAAPQRFGPRPPSLTDRRQSFERWRLSMGPRVLPGTQISFRRVCDRPLLRDGVAMPGVIQSFDSNGGLTVSWLPLTTSGMTILNPPVYQAQDCLPIETHDGRSLTFVDLAPRRLVIVWLSDFILPTQPAQRIPIGIEVFDSLPNP